MSVQSALAISISIHLFYNRLWLKIENSYRFVEYIYNVYYMVIFALNWMVFRFYFIFQKCSKYILKLFYTCIKNIFLKEKEQTVFTYEDHFRMHKLYMCSRLGMSLSYLLQLFHRRDHIAGCKLFHILFQLGPYQMTRKREQPSKLFMIKEDIQFTKQKTREKRNNFYL